MKTKKEDFFSKKLVFDIKFSFSSLQRLNIDLIISHPQKNLCLIWWFMFRKRENSVWKRENMSLKERRSFDQTTGC